MADACQHENIDWSFDATGKNAVLICEDCDRSGIQLALDLTEQGRQAPFPPAVPPGAKE